MEVQNQGPKWQGDCPVSVGNGGAGSAGFRVRYSCVSGSFLCAPGEYLGCNHRTRRHSPPDSAGRPVTASGIRKKYRSVIPDCAMHRSHPTRHNSRFWLTTICSELPASHLNYWMTIRFFST